MIVDGGPVVNGMRSAPSTRPYVTITSVRSRHLHLSEHRPCVVDTGSAGLRLITSAFTSQLRLPLQGTDTVANCVQFVNSIPGAPLRTADVRSPGVGQFRADPGDRRAAVPALPPGSCGSMKPAEYGRPVGGQRLLGSASSARIAGPAVPPSIPVTMQAPAGFYYTCPAPAIPATR